MLSRFSILSVNFSEMFSVIVTSYIYWIQHRQKKKKKKKALKNSNGSRLHDLRVKIYCNF